jgi:hypothetical protein
LETTTSYLLSPIKQNEEILHLFPHFALFYILYSLDSLQNSIGAMVTFFAGKDVQSALPEPNCKLIFHSITLKI